MSLPRLIRTLRHLRPGQIGRLAMHRVRSRFDDPVRLLREPVPSFPGVGWSPRTAWLEPVRSNDVESILAGRLTFAGETQDVGYPPRWTVPEASRLWSYNLHYLDVLWALDFDRARVIAKDYMDAHGPTRHRTGWEPYPISHRLINLCAVFFGRDRKATEADEPFCEELWTTIHRMARWLEGHLEWHLRGNHLLENVIALAFVGACLEAQADVRRWRELGCRLLHEQLDEQVLDDGGHYERSPMYHARLTHALAMLANAADEGLLAQLRSPLKRMTSWLLAMVHPDGENVLFNDSALGVYPTPGAIAGFVRDVIGEVTKAPDRPFSLPATGYFGDRSGDGNSVVIDAAPIGPDEQPGHAHADIFTFEMSVGGRRAVVDPGVYDYIPSEMRRYCRGTVAHNTVTVDDADQCEMWGSFRVGRRTRPQDVRFEILDDGFRLSGRHRGYAHLAGGPVHERTFRWHRSGVLLVLDQVPGGASHSVVSRVLLHPDWHVAPAGEGRLVCGLEGLSLSVVTVPGASLSVGSGWYCPRFGCRIETEQLVIEPGSPSDPFAYALYAGPSESVVSFDLELGLITTRETYDW